MKVARAKTTGLSIEVPRRFDLRTTLFGHGFIDLPPNRWHADSAAYHTTLSLGRRAVDVSVRQRKARLSVQVRSFGPLNEGHKNRIIRALVRMLRLDEDLRGFHDLCRADDDLRWVARRRAGALLRSETPFEDFAKVLLTTNSSWHNTRAMVGRLALHLGVEAPSGAHAFPSARAVSQCSETSLKRTARVGYRAEPLLLLARRFASTSSPKKFETLCRNEESLREYVLSLPGFGPYSAGQILRLSGHYTDFALDSWCVATLKKRGFQAASRTERALARRYERFGEFRGLAFWLDLTAPWHGEGPHAARGVAPLSRE